MDLNNTRTRLPSPEMLVALLALFVALGGTSYAVARASVGSREIKDNSIRSNDVRNGSLLARDFKPDQLPAGPPGATGHQGPPGERGQAGDPGTALAYARVKADGTLDAARSKGVPAGGVSTSFNGRYCFELAFTPKSAVVTVEERSSMAEARYANLTLAGAGSLGGCAPTAEAEVFTLNDAGAAPGDFYVVFN